MLEGDDDIDDGELIDAVNELEGDVGRNNGRGFLDDEAACDDVGGEGDIDDLN